MPLFPNWSWLPARFGPDASPAAPQSRPCLPSVEKLDGRVLLSVSASEFTIPKVLDKSTPLLQAEAAALLPVDGESTDAKHKDWFNELGVDFVKINSIFQQYEDDILANKVAPAEQKGVTEQLSLNFGKIEFLASKIDQQGGDGQLLPAVQKIRLAAMGDGSVISSENLGLLGDLSKITPEQVTTIPAEARAIFVKMNDSFWKLDEYAIDFKLDLIRGVPGDVATKQFDDKVQKEYLKIKLDQVFVSSYLDGSSQDALSKAIQNEVDAVNGIVHPVTNPDLLFAGGVTSPGGAGDTIV